MSDTYSLILHNPNILLQFLLLFFQLLSLVLSINPVLLLFSISLRLDSWLSDSECSSHSLSLAGSSEASSSNPSEIACIIRF